MNASSDFLRLDRDSAEPLHAQLREAILDAIEGGRWRPGDRLPSETELCRRFDISRTTVRQALTMLELEGALRREQGRGTFVAEPPPASGFLQSAAGFQEDAEHAGHVVTSQVLKCAVERMPLVGGGAASSASPRPTASASSACARSTARSSCTPTHG